MEYLDMERSKEEQALMSQVANARATLRNLEAKLKEVRIRKAGVVVGDIVLDHNDIEFEVRRIQPITYGQACLTVAKKKKDGTFGNATTSLYTWRKKP